MKIIKQILQQQKNKTSPLLIAHTIQKDKEFVYTHPEYKLRTTKYLKFLWYLHKIKTNYPLAYILKNKEFFNLDFFVNKHVLVPRPETEILVEHAIKDVEKENIQQIIDVGTGSGCIPISILKNINKKITTTAIDISKQALQVAKENAKKYNINIYFKRGDLLSPIIDKLEIKGNILITANLPYVTMNQYINEPSVQKEPRKALIATQDGLCYYYRLISQLSEIKKHPNSRWYIYLEIDNDQKDKMITCINNHLKKCNITTIKDLAGKNRTIKIVY